MTLDAHCLVGLLDLFRKVRNVARLHQVVVGTFTHSLGPGRERGMAGEHDHLRIRGPFLDFL